MMRRFDLLGPLGLVVIAGSWIAREAGKNIPGRFEHYVIGGAFLVLAHVILRFEDIVKAIGARQLAYGGNTLVLSLVVLGILGLLNYLVADYAKSWRWDLTKEKRFSLSDQTRKLVRGLKDDVKILYFQNWLDAAALEAAKDRLREYEALSNHLKLEYVNPRKSPRRAQEYEVTMIPTLVVERGTRREKISSDGEQEITNAIIKISREGKKTICFAEGEGERKLDDASERGYSEIKTALTQAGYETKGVTLLGEPEVSPECTAVVLAGPQKDLLPQAIDRVRAFVKKGGKVAVLLDPGMKESFANIEALLKEWNVDAGRDVVVDLYGEAAVNSRFAPLGRRYTTHEITRDFQLATVFLLARSVLAGTGTVEGVSAVNLVSTDPRSELGGQVLTWAGQNVRTDVQPNFDPAKDHQGPINLAVAATVKVADEKPSSDASPAPAPSPSPGEALERRTEGRIVVVGDSDFASNQLVKLPLGNLDFFMNSVAWLTQETDLISIRPKEADDQRMILTGIRRQSVFLTALIGLPGLFVVLGVVTWWRRR